MFFTDNNVNKSLIRSPVHWIFALGGDQNSEQPQESL